MTDLHELALTQMMHLIRSLQDGQIDHRAVSTETLSTVQTLTALLDLLNRPEDQHLELGQQLAESLRQLVANTQTIATDVTVITRVIDTQKAQTTELLSLMAAQQAEITALRQTLSITSRRVVELAQELLEDQATG